MPVDPAIPSQPALGSITLHAEYDARADALIARSTIKGDMTDLRISVLAQAVLTSEDELLDVSFQTLDEGKQNIEASTVHVNMGYASRFLGMAVTVVAAAQVIMPDGTEFDLYIDQQVRIERTSP